MLISELYTDSFSKEGRYAAKFDNHVLKNLEKSSQVIQAQNFVPLGKDMGDGTRGRTFEIIDNEGGLSPNRDYYGTVTPNVVAGTKKTVYMGNNAEPVLTDKNQLRIHGNRERDRQLNLAIARLQKTFVYKLFNADTTAIDETDKLNSLETTKKYDYDGWKRYFDLHKGQVENSVFHIGDVINNVNMKLEANEFLNDILSKVDVNGMDGEIIYSSRKGKNILKSLDTHRMDYTGMYKFTRKVTTWEGLPIVETPESSIPQAWKDKGEFVLFVNQDQESGARIMIPENGGLIVTHKPADKGYTVEIPMDMTFAPVLINGKAASLCFITMNKSVAETEDPVIDPEI